MAAFEQGARFHGERFPARIAFVQTGPRGLSAQPAGPDASAMGTDRPVRPDPAFDESISGMFVLDQTGFGMATLRTLHRPEHNVTLQRRVKLLGRD